MSTVHWVDRPTIEYPESDGLPMAENTLQFQWIVMVKENLEVVFADNPQVFVAGDLFWYPVEGDNKVRQAPDTLVVFGRPKGHRGSYRQWQEGGLAPQVVWEIWSPGNRPGEMVGKFQFYEKHGVEEYYVYDPDRKRATGWRRIGDRLIEIEDLNGWVSPRLGIRFELSETGLKLFRPDGQPFLGFGELEELRKLAELRANRAEQAAKQAEQDARLAKQDARLAKQDAKQAELDAQKAIEKAERLAAQLRALGVEPEK